MLLGVPVIGLVVGPLLRRLERAESVYRQQQGALTARAGDIVAGLRVLAGVGGRDLFARRYAARSQELRAEGYRVGAVNSWIDALTVAIPGLFLAAVVWLAARMAATGDITIGELVAVYGYVAILIVPVWFLLEGGYELIRGRVAARRIVAPARRLAPGRRSARPARGRRPAPGRPGRPARPGDRPDGAAPGRLLGVAADDPADGGRAGRPARPVRRQRRDLGRRAAGRGRAGRGPRPDPGRRPRLVPLRRRRCATSCAPGPTTTTPRSARRCGPPRPRTSSTRCRTGSTPPIDARARTLSGGQRQRVRLARALLAEPEVLILVDPTSAVDAHTEARIAERLRAARAGRTTVVLATSPLLLGRADTVALPGRRPDRRHRHATPTCSTATRLPAPGGPRQRRDGRRRRTGGVR